MHPYLKSFFVHAPRVAAKAAMMRKLRKTTEQTDAQYDRIRTQLLARFHETKPPVERYMEAITDGQPNMLLDGKRTSNHIAVLNRYFSELEQQINRYQAASAIEVGSGYGRNIIGLSARNPQMQLLGLELTRMSVDLSRTAAEHYGLNCRFKQFDATKEWEGIPTADVVFSVHALEQIPDASKVVDSMVAHARKAVIMFEPFPEYWRGIRGLASKIRALDGGRLRSGSLRNQRISRIEALNYGSHIMNMPTLVVIEKDTGETSRPREAAVRARPDRSRRR